jgi:hypothetical protein
VLCKVLFNVHCQDAVLENVWENGIIRVTVLRFGDLFSSSLHLFRFHILIFHLKQKHKKGQRLLHYLQQKNNPFSKVHLYKCKKLMDLCNCNSKSAILLVQWTAPKYVVIYELLGSESVRLVRVIMDILLHTAVPDITEIRLCKISLNT